MKAILFGSKFKPQTPKILTTLHKYLIDVGVEVKGSYSLDTLDDQKTLDSIKMDIADHEKNNHDEMVIFSIGGDGSLLKLAHALGLPLPPFVGINLGSLGFLAEIPIQNLTREISDIASGKYRRSKRLIIEGRVSSNSCPSSTYPFFAINECTLHRGTNPTLVDIAVFLDGTYVNTFSCDGIIISTPSGSTAYSLSAGGPILTPDLNALVITPICPHTISNKPIVLLPQQSLSLRYARGCDPLEISFDGQKNGQLEIGKEIEIKVSDHQFQLLSAESGNDYFHTVRSKLSWAGSLRH